MNRIAWLILAVSTVFVVGRAAVARAGDAGGESAVVALQLNAPGGSSNLFDVNVMVDSLAPSLGMLTAPQQLQLHGSLTVTLLLDREAPSGEPIVVGVEFISENSQLFFSDAEVHLTVPTGEVLWSTSNVMARMEAMPGAATASATSGQFSRTGYMIELMGGQAMIAVPTPKPPKMQYLESQAAYGYFPDDDAALGVLSLQRMDSYLPPSELPEGAAAVSIAGGLDPQPVDLVDYAVELMIPMEGLGLHFSATGLPSEILFRSGSLHASGVVTLPAPVVVPEPATGVPLGTLLAAAGAILRRRRGTRGS